MQCPGTHDLFVDELGDWSSNGEIRKLLSVGMGLSRMKVASSQT